MGLHTGEPERHEDGYIGIDVHRAARIAAMAATFLAGCSTDPYTGEQKISNTAVGATHETMSRSQVGSTTWV